MSKNKSLNTLENMVHNEESGEASTDIGNPVVDELTHRFIHTIIDFQGETNGIAAEDLLKSVQNLNKELLLQVADTIPEEKREQALTEIEETNTVFHDAVKSKYGDKPIDWFVLCYICTEIQREILGLD